MSSINPTPSFPTRRIAIANQKGGTAKTTTAINVAAALSRLGYRTLLVDIDPQANATAVFLTPAFTLGPTENTLTMYEVLIGGRPAAEARQVIDLIPNDRDGYKGSILHLLPSHIRLAKAEMELLGMLRREDRLTNALQELESDYDFIFIDCPPSLGMLTLNALMAAQQVLIPAEPGYFPLIGLNLLHQTITDVARINRLKLLGVIPTLQDRTNESRETMAALQEMFGEQVLPSIPRRVAIRDAHAAQTDIFGYPGAGDAADAYMILAQEILNRG